MNKAELKKRIGERCRQLRREKGYTSAERFAYEHDFARAAYTIYEQGKPTLNIELDTLIRLCNSYQVTLREFFSEGID